MNRRVLVAGWGQVTQGKEQTADLRDPLGLMAEAARRAADVAGSRELLGRLDAVLVVKPMSCSYPAAAEQLAVALGKGRGTGKAVVERRGCDGAACARLAEPHRAFGVVKHPECPVQIGVEPIGQIKVGSRLRVVTRRSTTSSLPACPRITAARPCTFDVSLK